MREICVVICSSSSIVETTKFQVDEDNIYINVITACYDFDLMTVCNYLVFTNYFA